MVSIFPAESRAIGRVAFEGLVWAEVLTPWESNPQVKFLSHFREFGSGGLLRRTRGFSVQTVQVDDVILGFR